VSGASSTDPTTSSATSCSWPGSRTRHGSDEHRTGVGPCAGVRCMGRRVRALPSGVPRRAVRPDRRSARPARRRPRGRPGSRHRQGRACGRRARLAGDRGGSR
jgi:hypothetical protein